MVSVIYLLLKLLVVVKMIETGYPHSVSPYKVPIIFVYTVVPKVCNLGLPQYIKISIAQAIFTQPDCDVYLLGNIGECAAIAESVKDLEGLRVLDSIKIESSRTKEFKNVSESMFTRDNKNELWLTSALRFFMLEDIMHSLGWKEMLHVEADNMLYGRITTILPILRSNYPLAATPLNAQLTRITASVFWINSVDNLHHFNDYLLSLGHDRDNGWKNYTKWMGYNDGCCKKGGVGHDKHVEGLKPFAVNEKTMIAHYHELHPERLRLLPVVPSHSYILNRYVVNMSIFSPEGPDVGGATGHGIWDPNSWGKWFGGTSIGGGRDRGFIDSTHIVGQAMETTGCFAAMLCANMSEYGFITQSSTIEQARCYSAPFVTCYTRNGTDAMHLDATQWTPLWNLHVHAKHTHKYKSKLCDCHRGMVPMPYIH